MSTGTDYRATDARTRRAAPRAFGHRLGAIQPCQLHRALPISRDGGRTKGGGHGRH